MSEAWRNGTGWGYRRPARRPGSPLVTIERMFETRCPDCSTTVAFPNLPGDAECAACGLRLYVTDDQAIGRYPEAHWSPGGIQGRRAPNRTPADEAGTPHPSPPG